jgi:hypothetical protein
VGRVLLAALDSAVVPLYEIDAQGELLPFRRLHGGADLYEREIEDLVWENAEELLGETLFLVERQATLQSGGRPDIVALDRDARVVVIEVKREFDRGQLAQCLEYAGWARKTNLDELAQMYRHGADRFFSDWQEFTESPVPAIVNPSPRLMLLAGSFHGRTASAVEFLIENRLPVKVVPVTIYEDRQGRRFVDVEGEHEPDFTPVVEEDDVDHTKINGRRVRLTDLLDAGLVDGGEPVYWERRNLGHRYDGTITEGGTLALSDGRAFASPSRAAMEAANIVAYDGWLAWRVPRLGGKTLDELRRELVREVGASAEEGIGT